MILVSPIITEKSMKHAGDGKYTFLVAKGATKKDVKKEVEKAFKVHVTKVMTVTTKGRTKRIGQRREEVSVPAFKKAVVVVKKGEKITLFEESK